MNRAVFFNTIRRGLFHGVMTQAQVDGIEKVLDEWERRRLSDLRQLGYILATDYHETGRTMQPVREFGSEAYLRAKAYYPWVGEGLVQVTWEVNHRKFGATKPGELLTWPVALRALFDGMLNGMFTGKKLSDYFHGGTADWKNARRIVNGIDKAETIAGYARSFYTALLTAAEPAGSAPSTPTIDPGAHLPAPAPPPPHPATIEELIARFLSWVASLFSRR